MSNTLENIYHQVDEPEIQVDVPRFQVDVPSRT
jgi:hypothetical protein